MLLALSFFNIKLLEFLFADNIAQYLTRLGILPYSGRRRWIKDLIEILALEI
jgi:hypothetical protein